MPRGTLNKVQLIGIVGQDPNIKSGNINECQLTEEDRKNGINIEDLIEPQ